LSCHEHNQLERLAEIEAAIRGGGVVALISDAGMPLISDPGAPLVTALQAKQLPVTVIPGANAALAALSLSGLPNDRFCFAGFLPNRAGARRQELSALAGIPATLIFYESPQRLTDLLADIEAVLGERPVAVIRELTKLHEEIRRGSVQDLLVHYTQHPPRGEIVVCVAPPAAIAQWDAAQIDTALQKHNGSLRDRVAVVTAQSGWPRREVYARAVAQEQRKK
jgi:16S rRNA (cytidine1402-2'-O)-methyltransferase